MIEKALCAQKSPPNLTALQRKFLETLRESLKFLSMPTSMSSNDSRSQNSSNGWGAENLFEKLYINLPDFYSYIKNKFSAHHQFSAHQKFFTHFRYYPLREPHFTFLQYQWLLFESRMFLPSWYTSIYNMFDSRSRLYQYGRINSLQIEIEKLV